MTGRRVSSRPGVLWTELALDDLKRERAYLHRYRPSAAREFAKMTKDAVKTLTEHPEAGRVHEDLLPVGRYRYLLVNRHQLIYRRDQDMGLVILRLWDARQDPSSLALK